MTTRREFLKASAGATIALSTGRVSVSHCPRDISEIAVSGGAYDCELRRWTKYPSLRVRDDSGRWWSLSQGDAIYHSIIVDDHPETAIVFPAADRP